MIRVWLPLRMRATPKSAIFTFVSAMRRMLADLMSRWMTLLRNAKSSAPERLNPISTTSGTGRRPRGPVNCARLPPGQFVERQIDAAARSGVELLPENIFTGTRLHARYCRENGTCHCSAGPFAILSLPMDRRFGRETTVRVEPSLASCDVVPRQQSRCNDAVRRHTESRD